MDGSSDQLREVPGLPPPLPQPEQDGAPQEDGSLSGEEVRQELQNQMLQLRGDLVSAVAAPRQRVLPLQRLRHPLQAERDQQASQ